MSAPHGEVVPLTDDQILLDALAGEQRAWRRLTDRFDPFLWSIARRRLADLPPDIQAEFLQEVWIRVASRAEEDFDLGADSALVFIGQFVSAAINKVRADYCPPGQRTRDRTAPEHLVPLAEVGLLRDERAAALFEAAAARLDLARLMAIADTTVRQGLEIMLDEETTTTAAARRIGMPRQTFRRRMLALPARLRTAADRRRHIAAE